MNLDNIERNTFLYFFADWCTPCKHIKPIIKKLKEKYHNIDFKEIDVDLNENLEIKNKFSIKAIPTFIIITPQKRVSVQNGTLDEKKMVEWVDEAIK